MNADKILDRVKQVDIFGILNVSKAKIRNDGSEGIIIEFWRIRGAFKNDREEKISMALDPDGPGGDLYFVVPPLDSCKPGDMDLTIYMDANMRTIHGAHRWKASEKGEVVFSYSLPLPPGNDDFPDVELFHRLLVDMYEGLLFPEIKDWEFRILRDDMLSEEEKKAKNKKVFEMYKKLTGPRAADDGSV
jgi:hypothetical protein